MRYQVRQVKGCYGEETDIWCDDTIDINGAHQRLENQNQGVKSCILARDKCQAQYIIKEAS